MKAVFDDTFVERLCEQEHIGDRIRIVEEYLLSYLSRHYQSADSHIVVAVDIINQFGGKRPVRSLIDEVCLCRAILNGSSSIIPDSLRKNTAVLSNSRMP